ncbi:recombinase family protein [Paenibacillus sp. p3-SID867]|uniref:recombinase family protein n=1 Tax=Paenibacillus sp. p3-SID867 TaxID=2916363 RepID=UPI0021A84287|nr:recombinase family protein [Paenibacillus sp. p3-SID867]MCT1398094.1 recombinase family protein [Paenibacillus sp. p3-SID867]
MNHKQQLAALYIRVSTEEQVEGYSLDAQRAALLDYCQRARVDVHKVYVDAGRSGKSIDGRPALRRLLEDARCGRFQQVVCLRLNRLSRKLSDLLHIVELLNMNGIALRSLTEELQTDTPMGKFALQMAGSVAEHERRQIAQNVRHSMQRRSRLGKWNSGNQVLGYRWVTHPVDPHLSYVEIVPEEARRVISIFELYANGLGLKAIVNRLNGDGHKTKRDKAFQSASVRGILTNVNYIGKITYTDENGNRKIVDGEHEPIVSKELWKNVQRQLTGRSHQPIKRITRPFPLAGLLKCPTCGSSMIPCHVPRKRKNGAQVESFYYVCCRYNSGGSAVCPPNHIRANEAETWVEFQVQHFVAHPSVAERLVTEINHRRDKKLLPTRRRMRQIDSQLTSLKSRSLRCYELFEDGYIDAQELRKRLDEIRTESALLKEEREQLERSVAEQTERSIPAANIRQALDNFRPLLRSASAEQRKKLYRSLIDKIVVPHNRDITRATIQGTAALLNLEIPLIPIRRDK